MNLKVDFAKLISVTGTLLFCSGLISQTVYYFFFNIHITEFLSISEVLLLFTDDILRYVIIFLVLTIISIVASIGQTGLYHKRFFIRYCETTSIWDRIKNYVEYKLFSIIYFVIGGSILFLLVKEGSKVLFLFTLYYSIEVIYFFLRFYIYEYKRRLRKGRKLKKEDENVELSLSYFTHFIFFILCWTLIDVQRVKYQGKFINVSFETADREILSDSTKYYIGQTEKFLFYYDSKQDRTTVFKMDDIKSITFGKILYWGDSTLTDKNVMKQKATKADSATDSTKIKGDTIKNAR